MSSPQPRLFSSWAVSGRGGTAAGFVGVKVVRHDEGMNSVVVAKKFRQPV